MAGDVPRATRSRTSSAAGRHRSKGRHEKLLQQHLEVRPVVASRQPAEAALDRTQCLLADPECQQRAENQAERATKRRAESEQEIAGVLVAVHRYGPSL